ncbi:MAG: protein glxC [Granulosicoccus sp.]|nr:protein glxC [Granulosicoccus sp.]
MTSFDLDSESVRALNAHLHSDTADSVTVTNPGGRHAVAVGAIDTHKVTVHGNVGYYCAGMNQKASITVQGHAGPGLAENMMSGTVRVTGNASQYCAATAHGGLVIVEGDASSRCGISMKGVDIVVRGNIGHMSAFMAQKGALLVCGDAGDALGDSIYEARLYVRGSVASLGADCIEKEMRAEHLEQVTELLRSAEISDLDPSSFKRYGSARNLYHFKIDNASAY